MWASIIGTILPVLLRIIGNVILKEQDKNKEIEEQRRRFLEFVESFEPHLNASAKKSLRYKAMKEKLLALDTSKGD